MISNRPSKPLIKFLSSVLLSTGLYSCAEAVNPTSAATFDQTYHMMPHNSYEYLLDKNPSSSMSLLLGKGYRSLEIDIFNRPNTGNDYVSHEDSSNRNSCKANSRDGSLKDCLQSVNNWIIDHRFTGPVSLFLDLKDMPSWDLQSFQQLEKTLSIELGGANIIRPEELLNWSQKANKQKLALRQSLAQTAWPTPEAMDNMGKVIIFYTAGSPSFYQQTINAQGSKLSGFPCPNVTKAEQFKAQNPAYHMDKTSSNWVVCGNLRWQNDSQAHAILKTARSNHQVNHIWEMEPELDFDRQQDLDKALSFGAQFINRNDFAEPNDFNGAIKMRGTLKD